MIRGIVTADREAVLSIQVRGQNGQQEEIAAVLDTGFNGFLTLPISVVRALGLHYYSEVKATLGDGNTLALDLYEVVVVWDGVDRDVLALCAESDPLVGMALIRGHDLWLRATDGGEVEIQPAP